MALVPDLLNSTTTLTLAMLVAALPDATPMEVFVGNDSSTFWTAWKFWRTTQFEIANQTVNEDMRWQRVSTNVLGGPSALP